jgi:hypothetical protein
MKGQRAPEKVSRETKPAAATHTAGLARIESKTGPCVIAVGEREICECYLDGEVQTVEDELNAKRVVACWNACDGVKTETLEHGGVKACMELATEAARETDDVKDRVNALSEEMRDICIAVGRSKDGSGVDVDWLALSEDVEELKEQRDDLVRLLRRTVVGKPVMRVELRAEIDKFLLNCTDVA